MLNINTHPCPKRVIFSKMYGSDHHSEEYLDYFGVTIKRTQYTDCKSLLKRLQSSFKTEIDNTPKPVVCKAKSEIKELSGSVTQLPEDKINNSHDTKYCTTVYSNDERLLSENGDSYSQGPKCFGTVALPVYDIMMKDLLSYVPASVHNVFNADNKNKTQLSENANSFSQGPDYFRAIEFPEYDIKLKEDVLPSVPASPIDICTVNNNSEKQSSDDKASQNQSPESVCLTECEFKSKEILPPLLVHSNDSEPSTVDNNDKRQLSGDEDEETTWNFLYESFIKENEVLTDEDYSLVAKEENDACKTGVVDTVDKGKTTITKSVSDSCQIEEPTVLSKSYMLPYKSNNEEENKDNEDPKWKNYEKLRTDKERYHYARSRWRSMVIPNPNVDISSFMFKWKKAPEAKCDGEHSRNSSQKRPLADAEQLEGRPPNKRVCRINTDFIQQSYSESIRQAEINCSTAVNERMQNKRKEKINMLKMAKLEISGLHEFYEGLPDQDSSVSQEQVEQGHIDSSTLCKAFEHVYKCDMSEY